MAEAADFECLTSWTHIRHFRIANPLGHLDEALAVARGEAPPPYPIGTIIQLVPTEAMVKRGGGFFPAAHDWEFFVLSPSSAGTQITKRGRDEVVNIGPPCFACHGAATQTDFICENRNGCIAPDRGPDQPHPGARPALSGQHGLSALTRTGAAPPGTPVTM